MLQAPIKIIVLIDNNELELQSVSGKNAVYKYTKSLTKFDLLLPVTEELLRKMERNCEFIYIGKEVKETVAKPITWLPKMTGHEAALNAWEKTKPIKKDKPNQTSLF